jgi:AcrR family transcriptional regulator
MATTTYHHGNLRRALLDASVDVIAERGPDDFTLREIARRAGVSHNAPYHHFADKEALVAELCIESFTMLRAELLAIERRGGPLERIRRLGVAYVRFALDNRPRFRVMWRPELRGGLAGETPEDADADAYGVLLEAIDEARVAGKLAAGSRERIALTAWSTVHGLALLLLDGPLADKSRDDALALAEDVVKRLLRGLAA